MADLQKIRNLALHYGVTPRTLRYYEEIGILWSERTLDSAYRQYDGAAIKRLQQILLLRQMQIPVKEIQAIFQSADLQVAVDAFARKVESIDQEMAALSELREAVAAFLAVLREKGLAGASDLKLLEEHAAAFGHAEQGRPMERKALREDFTMTNELTHVRIVELKPMNVAAYRAISTTPEDDAWTVLKQWIEEKGLQDLPATRYFGFDTSAPAPGRPEYGYEVWVTVPDGLEASGPVQIKEFAGGLYAVISSYGHEIPQRWQQLAQWVKASDKYAVAPGQCLEETTTPYGAPGSEMQLDLLEPIIRK